MVCLGLPLVLMAGLFAGVRAYLSPKSAGEKVAAQLESLFGVPVRVGRANLGFFSSSSLQKVQIFAPGDTALNHPWIEIETASADVTLFNLLSGATPAKVDLDGLSAFLAFDEQGKLLTRFPLSPAKATGPMPAIQVSNGRLTLAQAGRATMAVESIQGDLVGVDGKLAFTGSIDDAFWGKWQAKARRDQATGELTLDLHADMVSVDQAKLESLPFVPPSIWNQIKAEGVTPVDFTLVFQPHGDAPGTTRYRVVLAPEKTRIQVTSIGLNAVDAKGKVVVEDKVVQLRDVSGRSADGDIFTNADLDFRQDTSTMRFLVAVRDMVMRKLPASWSLPLFDGLLTGHADIRLTVRDGKVRTEGGGEGTIAEPRLGGLTPKIIKGNPLRLELKSDGERFRLDAPRSLLKTLLPALLPR